MDVEEFLTWAAYYTIEPPGEFRSDVHVAMLMAQQYNLNRGKTKPVKKPMDFLPQWYRMPKPEQSPEMMLRAAQAQFLSMGGDYNELGLES